MPPIALLIVLFVLSALIQAPFSVVSYCVSTLHHSVMGVIPACVFGQFCASPGVTVVFVEALSLAANGLPVRRFPDVSANSGPVGWLGAD